MKIKTVESFTLDECREYLKNHPERDDVRERMEWLERQEEQKQEEQTHEQIRRQGDQTSQNEKTPEQPLQDDAASVRWIDKQQFLETRRFRRMFRRTVILYPIIKLMMLLAGFVLYIVFPLFLYCIAVDITENPIIKWLTRDLCSIDLLYLSDYGYMLGFVWNPILFIAGCSAILSILLLIFSSFPLLKAYNVEDRHYVKTGDYILMQNKEGKIALCKVLRVRIRQVLGFCHDSIRECGNGSYICQIGSRYGLYNTDLKKMMLPVEYDNIKYTEEGTILAEKDGVVYRFTGKGYRKID